MKISLIYDSTIIMQKWEIALQIWETNTGS